MKIVEMTIKHYDEVMSLLRNTPGITIRDADSKEATEMYLERNPGLSFVAIENGSIIGCAMCGHDGRRGYLQHVAVLKEFRGKGIANEMVNRCLEKLEKAGIYKTHLDVLVTNELANSYWIRKGWQKRDDINRYSFTKAGKQNA